MTTTQAAVPNLDDLEVFPRLSTVPRSTPHGLTTENFTAMCSRVIRQFMRRQLAPTREEEDEERMANAWYWSLD